MNDDIIKSLQDLLDDMGALEPLEKGKCVRCGNTTSGGKGSRCAACLKKLRTKRKTPGSKERAWQHADQALRRQRAGKGTTSHKKHKGLGNRQEIQRKMQAAEKKTGEKLSADRKDNNSGYTSKNVRAIPTRLNRGRHHADPKKLAAWRKKLKKHDLTPEELGVLLLAKSLENGKEITQDQLQEVIDMLNDTDE